MTAKEFLKNRYPAASLTTKRTGHHVQVGRVGMGGIGFDGGSNQSWNTAAINFCESYLYKLDSSSDILAVTKKGVETFYRHSRENKHKTILRYKIIFLGQIISEDISLVTAFMKAVTKIEKMGLKSDSPAW